jgi:antitoxin VapB
MYIPSPVRRDAEGRTLMTRTKLFRSNRSQAVRLPKGVAFPQGVTEVDVIRDGKRRVIAPANAVWDDFFDAPGIDLPPRDQPRTQERDEI